MSQLKFKLYLATSGSLLIKTNLVQTLALKKDFQTIIYQFYS